MDKIFDCQVKFCKSIYMPRLLNLEIESYEATSSRKNRSLAKELTTATVASVFMGFGSLFLLLASGVFV
nr:transmembrane protein 258 [Ipomoea batatas]GMC96189.1 transmembrane protein 258 [Ipomoea batatas]GMD41237.1 transmembrane protein 258 [Ipomoea batatas]GME18127.1 transmembrane protein 258 [Ipomoea batatas]